MASLQDNPGTAPIQAIDFSRYLNGTNADRALVAQEIDAAFRTLGFVYLSNHTMPPHRIATAFAWSKAFFSLPHATKMKAPHPPGGAHHRGYSGVGLEKVSQNVFDRAALVALRDESPDVKESFESGRVDDDVEPNIWLPEEELPGFRAFMEGFYEDCAALVETIFACFALALDLPDPSVLTAPHKDGPCQLRLLHYPAIETAALQDGTQTRISAHSDFGTATLLFQDGVGGLEIEDLGAAERGVFRAVEPRTDCVLVNVGDLLERWSNGRWKSTVHRVGAPVRGLQDGGSRVEQNAELSQGKVTPDRYSIPFFATCGRETVIDALPGCWGPHNPKKWEPITAHEYIQMRMQALY